MKHFYFFCFIFSLCYTLAEAQTNASVPGPENVLVVYNELDSTSVKVKNYYRDARSIPTTNILGLDSLPEIAYYNGESVKLDQDNEIIRRNAPCADDESNQVCDDSYAWQYFEDYIAGPIRNHLNTKVDPNTGDTLYKQIRYIVLCKGVPLKIQSGHAQTWNAHQILVNVSVNALLSVLNTNGNQNPSPVSLYKGNKIQNPYHGADEYFTMEYRFLPNFFNNGNLKLSYLVSRLDGINYDEVENLIYRSVNADTSGNGLWVLDGHPQYGNHNLDASSASEKIRLLGFNDTLNTNNTPIFNINQPVIGYTSQGAHAGYGATYFQTSLNFEYLNGAICNTYESYNSYSMNPSYRRDGHGLISEFVKRRPSSNQAGTGAMGNCWEPYESGIIDNRYFFPSYAVGYGLVDAAYMGMQYLAWQNVVIGDPLTTIAWGKQTLTANTEWEGTNLVTGIITVPQHKTLTIKEDAEINFRHLGSLEIDGYLVIEKGAKLNFHNGGQLVVNNGIKISGASNKYVEIDFISPNSTTENGIILNDGAFEDSLMYVKITNAYRGLTVNETDPFINYAEITGCHIGIYGIAMPMAYV